MMIKYNKLYLRSIISILSTLHARLLHHNSWTFLLSPGKVGDNFQFFLHHFVLAKLATTSIRVKKYHFNSFNAAWEIGFPL